MYLSRIASHLSLSNLYHSIGLCQELTNDVNSLFYADNSSPAAYSFVLNKRIGISEFVISYMIMEEQIGSVSKTIKNCATKEWYFFRMDVRISFYC